jgi:hypothetical protein
MRLVHGVEIALDSLVHAWVLVALLVAKSKTSSEDLSLANAE